MSRKFRLFTHETNEVSNVASLSSVKLIKKNFNKVDVNDILFEGGEI